jgi:hypothetical protein
MEYLPKEHKAGTTMNFGNTALVLQGNMHIEDMREAERMADAFEEDDLADRQM